MSVDSDCADEKETRHRLQGVTNNFLRFCGARMATDAEDASTFKYRGRVVRNRLRRNRRFGRRSISTIMAMQSDTASANGLAECVGRMPSTKRINSRHSGKLYDNSFVSRQAAKVRTCSCEDPSAPQTWNSPRPCDGFPGANRQQLK